MELLDLAHHKKHFIHGVAVLEFQEEKLAMVPS
jgi:hypothetical protein